MSEDHSYYLDGSIPVLDAVKALAFVGDLSMGQPVDHSARTATLTANLAAALGIDKEHQAHAVCVALLRWSGCTANAPEMAELLGDDVDGRLRMMTSGLPAHLIGKMGAVAQIHCEVSGDVAQMLGLPQPVVMALRRIFETLDGGGKPLGLSGEEVPLEVQLVQTAGYLEIYSRLHGLDGALHVLAALGGKLFPADWLLVLRNYAPVWMQSINDESERIEHHIQALIIPSASVQLELISDVIDLKLPWMTGYSRRVATAAVACAERMGLSLAERLRIRRASLIHGLGRAAVPNEVWNQSVPRGEADVERLRLVPYWTLRAGRRISHLAAEAEIASYADERLDGSGAFRGAKGVAIGIEARVLAAATRWVILQTRRPGRPAQTEAEATSQLAAESERGLFDWQVASALTCGPKGRPAQDSPASFALLSPREIEVLRCISYGESNKETARTLSISPSTVRTHLENIFRKLDCSTRAAATLKALSAGLL